MFEKILKHVKRLTERGQYMVEVGGVIGLLVSIAVSAFAFYQITGAIEPELGSRAVDVLNNVEEKGSTAFNLMTILAIVMVAATIIGVVVRAIGGYGARAPPEEPAPAYFTG